MNTDHFSTEVEKRLHQLFRASKEGYKIPASQRHRLEGFIQAGVFLRLTTRSAMTDLMERVHLEVFGLTIAERRFERRPEWSEVTLDYEDYDIPTYLRR